MGRAIEELREERLKHKKKSCRDCFEISQQAKKAAAFQNENSAVRSDLAAWLKWQGKGKTWLKSNEGKAWLKANRIGSL